MSSASIVRSLDELLPLRARDRHHSFGAREIFGIPVDVPVDVWQYSGSKNRSDPVKRNTA